MYKKIMVPLDGSELAECVLPHVEGFITCVQVETVVFVRVIEPTPVRYSLIGGGANTDYSKIVQENITAVDEERKSAATGYLRGVISRVKQDGVKMKEDVLIGQVADRLVDYVADSKIDLVLIATHGRSGVSRWVRGSIADKVLRASRAPVLMVRADGQM